MGQGCFFCKSSKPHRYSTPGSLRIKFRFRMEDFSVKVTPWSYVLELRSEVTNMTLTHTFLYKLKQKQQFNCLRMVAVISCQLRVLACPSRKPIGWFPHEEQCRFPACLPKCIFALLLLDRPNQPSCGSWIFPHLGSAKTLLPYHSACSWVGTRKWEVW